MRRGGAAALLIILLLSVPSASAATCLHLGADVNGDKNLNIIDVQCVILGTLWGLSGGKTTFPPCLTLGWGMADLDCGGTLEVVDAQLAIMAVVQQFWPVELDSDQDDCLDACSPSCCTAHAGVGCARTGCMECVCDYDPVCCTIAWDEVCAREQTRACAKVCHCLPVGPKPCCGVHDGPGCDNLTCQAIINNQDDLCWWRFWDEPCAYYATVSHPAECGCPVILGDCCAPHFGPACDGAACTECVCAQFPSCCTWMWDQQCSNAAKESCSGACACPPEPKGDCCKAHTGTGCSNAACEACVCAADSNCCDATWDGICAGVLASECQSECNCMTYGGTDSCKEYHEPPGCNDEKCAQCVCTQDPWCCRKRWDKACVARALGPCAGSCGP